MRTKNNKKNSGILNHFTSYVRDNRLGTLLVRARIITPRDLRHALRAQKTTSLTLGQVLLAQGLISKPQLALVLGRQYVLRGIAAFLLFCVSLSSPNQDAQADAIRDVPGQISLAFAASAKASYQDINVYPSLWGSAEKPSRNLKAFTKWSGMFTRFEREIEQGRANKVMTRWGRDLEAMQGLPLKAMAGRVNAMINETRYVPDSRNWGKSDHWATPAEFIARGGDCEDFAIAKYTALRMMGVPEDRLRLAIVHDNLKNIPHAVLVVYTEQGPYILDNQIKTMISARSGSRYRPIFSINRQAWWLHTQPQTTRVASVN